MFEQFAKENRPRTASIYEGNDPNSLPARNRPRARANTVYDGNDPAFLKTGPQSKERQENVPQSKERQENVPQSNRTPQQTKGQHWEEILVQSKDVEDRDPRRHGTYGPPQPSVNKSKNKSKGSCSII